MESVNFRSERDLETAPSSLFLCKRPCVGKRCSRSPSRLGLGEFDSLKSIGQDSSLCLSSPLTSPWGTKMYCKAWHVAGCFHLHQSPKSSERLLPKARALMFWVTRPKCRSRKGGFGVGESKTIYLGVDLIILHPWGGRGGGRIFMRES